MNFTKLFAIDIKIFYPEIFFSLEILILLLYGLFLSTSRKYNYPLINHHVYSLLLYLLAISFLLVLSNPVDYALIFEKTYIQDDLSKMSKLFLLASTVASFSLSLKYVENFKINNYEYFFSLFFSLFALFLLASSYDLISAYLAIEMQTLAFFLLASFKRNSLFSTEAGLKYFILGAFSSGLLLYAFSIIYGVTGSTNISTLKYFCNDTSLEECKYIKISILFLSAAFFFKINAYPFHMWSPDVYEGSPTSTTVFFALIPKIAYLTFFLRVYYVAFSNFFDFWSPLFLFAALGSIIYSSFLALKQNSLKRLLAYSSIGQVGFILLPLAISNDLDAIHSSFFYLFVYLLSSIPAWGAVIFSMNAKKTSQNNINILAALPNTSPILALVAAFSFFSLAGIPPLVGFYSKLFIFFTLINNFYYLLAFVVLVASLLSIYYYLNIVKTLYSEKGKNWIFYPSLSKEKSIILALSFFFLLYFFFRPTFLLLFSEIMAISLYS